MLGWGGGRDWAEVHEWHDGPKLGAPRLERARPCGWRLPPASLNGSAAEKLGGRAAPNQGSRSWQASSEGFDKRVAGMRKLS